MYLLIWNRKTFLEHRNSRDWTGYKWRDAFRTCNLICSLFSHRVLQKIGQNVGALYQFYTLFYHTTGATGLAIRRIFAGKSHFWPLCPTSQHSADSLRVVTKCLIFTLFSSWVSLLFSHVHKNLKLHHNPQWIATVVNKEAQLSPTTRCTALSLLGISTKWRTISNRSCLTVIISVGNTFQHTGHLPLCITSGDGINRTCLLFFDIFDSVWILYAIHRRISSAPEVVFV